MNKNNTQVYLSLGGNEGPVLDYLKKALTYLSHQEGVFALQTSHFYQTAPLQMESASWFVNAVCSFRTFLTLHEVYEMTQSIEIQFGKVKKPKNAPRPIDIDLLFYGDQIYEEEELVIPHSRWKERLFVLVPLADLIKEISFFRRSTRESYILQELIQPLLSIQHISLLEKNPGLQ